MRPAITITPWADPVIDTLGHDPRSWYAETFWLPTLGPTCLLLLRHLADRFDRSPEGLELPIADTSAALGLGPRDGANTPLLRSLSRLVQFGLACDDGQGTVAVRRNLPPVHRRHVRRLPAAVQELHTTWVERQLQTPPLDLARRRARRVAYTLAEQGDDPDTIERALQGLGFHPALCRETALWARSRRDGFAPDPAASPS